MNSTNRYRIVKFKLVLILNESNDASVSVDR